MDKWIEDGCLLRGSERKERLSQRTAIAVLVLLYFSDYAYIYFANN